MIRLQLLGSTALTAPDRDLSGLLGRRKHMALLAYLAVEPGRYHARSVLCGLLWPESDERRARRSLRVALHDLRDQLGDDAVLSRSDGALAVNPERVTCDVPRLTETAAEARGQEIARLYRGPLLEGFYTDSPPFDRWVEERRAALEQAAADGLRGAARNALEGSAWEDAVTLSGELLRIRPMDVEAVGIRVEALASLERTGRALEALDGFRARFVEELELPPPDALRELETRIRHSPAGPIPAPDVVEPEPTPEPTPEPSSGTRPEADPEDEPFAPGQAASAPEPAGPTAEPLSSEGEGSGRRRWWRRTAVGVGAVGLVVLALVTLVLVLPGSKSGGSSGGSPHVPAPGAREWMEEAQRLSRAGLYDDAVGAFRAAVSADPEWGEAYYHLALAADRGGWPDVRREALDEALARVEAMTPRIRARIEAFDLALRGRPVEARSAYLAILDEASDDPGVLAQLGELEFHWGPTVGVPAETARDRFDKLLELRPGNAEALLHLARVDAIAGDLEAVRGRLDALSAEAPESARSEVTTLARVLAGAPLDAVAAVPAGAQVGIMRSVAASRAPRGSREAFFEAMVEAAAGERERLLARIFRALVALESGRLGEARAWLDRLGPEHRARTDELTAAAVTLPSSLPSPALLQELDGRLAEREGDLLVGPTEWDLMAPAIYLPRLVFLRSLLRGPGQVLSGSDRFESLDQRTWVDTANINLMRRILEARDGLDAGRDPEAILAILPPPDAPPDRQYPTVLSYPTAHLRFWRARILRDLDRDEDALTWYRTFPDPRGYDLAFLPAVLVERGQVERRLGRTDDARASFRRAVALLEGADPPYRSLLAAARRGLAGL